MALQQIQQSTMPQVANLLQAAGSSTGLTAVMMPSMSTTVPLATVSTNALTQPQISTIMLNNGTLQIQTQGVQQVTTPQVQHMQIQQQQQYEQQIQQLQIQAFNLQQQQQQLQQRLQQTQQQLQQAQQQQHLQQSIQHCLPTQVTLHTTQQPQQQQQQQQQIIQQQEIHVVQPQQLLQDNTQRDVQQDNQQSVANIPVSNIVTVAIPTSLAVSQATQLNAEPFLTSEVFQLALNQLPQHLVIPVSSNNNVTQGVPVSLIQTTQNSL